MDRRRDGTMARRDASTRHPTTRDLGRATRDVAATRATRRGVATRRTSSRLDEADEAIANGIRDDDDDDDDDDDARGRERRARAMSDAPSGVERSASGTSTSSGDGWTGDGVAVAARASGERAVVLRTYGGDDGDARTGKAVGARVVRVCGATGTLMAGKGVVGEDAFEDVERALEALRERGYVEEIARGAAALGYGVFGDVAAMLIAKTVRVAAVLPTGDEVMQVKESAWVRVSLRNACAGLSRDERVNLQSLCEFSVDGTHFYCRTFDVSRPFAYGNAEAGLQNPDREWVWNASLAAPLRATGIPGACPTLIQGLVEHRELRDSNDKLFNLCIFGKRSSLHPGTRYLARGLNDVGAPGNEVEMEQLVWCEVDQQRSDSPEASEAGLMNGDARGGSVSSKDGKLCSWTSYVWRRGSVPISWAQEIKQAYGEAEIQVAKENPYRGTGTYFARVMNAYRTRAVAAANGERQSFPITCVNLLRCAPGKPEMLLSEHFHEAVRGVRQRAGLADVSVLNFDWHANCKALGEAKTVEGLWAALRRQLIECSISMGSTCAVADEDGVEKTVSSWQRGLLRYNCADSLDRTNLAGFFVASQVLTEQCSELGLSVFNANANAGLAYGGGAHSEGVLARTSSGSMLPPGWESRTDTTTGRTFYIDHNTRTTSWSLPEQDTTRSEPIAVSPNKTVESPSQAQSPDSNMGSPGQSKLLSRLNSSGQRLCQAGGAEWLDELMKSPEKAHKGAESFKWLESTVDEFRAAMLPQCLTAMVEIFLANGDFHAQMYTSTRASHTATIHLLDANPATAAAIRYKSTPTSASSTMSNAALGIQRRFHNMVSDGTKQQQFEMFLGLNHKKYFPSMANAPGRVVTRIDAASPAKLPPCVKEDAADDLMNTMLSSCGASIAAAVGPLWITPRGSHDVSFEYNVSPGAGKPEYLLVTSPVGVPEAVAPSHVDVVVRQGGRNVEHSFALPRMPAGTQFSFSIREASAAADGGFWRFDRDAVESHDNGAYTATLHIRNHLGDNEATKDTFLAIGQFELVSVQRALTNGAKTQASLGQKPPLPRSLETNEPAPSPTNSEKDYADAMHGVVPGEASLATLLELELVRMRARMAVATRDTLIVARGCRASDFDPTERLKIWLARSHLRELESERTKSSASTSTSGAISSLRSLSLSSLTESIMGPMIRPNAATLSHVTNALGSHQAAANASATFPMTVKGDPEDERCSSALDGLREISSELFAPLDHDAGGNFFVECSAEACEAEKRAETGTRVADLIADADVRSIVDGMHTVRREYMRATFEQCSLNGASLHVGVPSSVVVGFKLAVPDLARAYAPCVLRVVAVCDVPTDDLVHVADYVIPATKPRTTLHYELGGAFAERQPKSLLFHLFSPASAAAGAPWSLHGRIGLYAHALDPPSVSPDSSPAL